MSDLNRYSSCLADTIVNYVEHNGLATVGKAFKIILIFIVGSYSLFVNNILCEQFMSILQLIS